jgi:hypothetical protein
MAARGLYKAADGSWRQSELRAGVRLLYRLKDRERWTLLDDDRVMVIHPNRPPKGRLPGRARGEDRPNTDLAKRISPHPAPKPAGTPSLLLSRKKGRRR